MKLLHSKSYKPRGWEALKELDEQYQIHQTVGTAIVDGWSALVSAIQGTPQQQQPTQPQGQVYQYR